MAKKILVTGAAGFIGSNFVLDWLAQSDETVVNLDALTYAGNLENLASLQNDLRHIFVHGSIGDIDLVTQLLVEHQPRADGKLCVDQITYVKERSGHDCRYILTRQIDRAFVL